MLAYSVEYDEDAKFASTTSDDSRSETPVNQKHLDEMAHSIQVAGDLEAQYVASGYPRGKAWVALKLVRGEPIFQIHTPQRLSVVRVLFSESRRAWSGFQYISIPHGVPRLFLYPIHTPMNLETWRYSRTLRSLLHRTPF